jgi:hypothetical protein
LAAGFGGGGSWGWRCAVLERLAGRQKGPVDAALRALDGTCGGCGLGPKFMAGRLFASSASPHRGPDSAVFSPNRGRPAFTSIGVLRWFGAAWPVWPSFESCGPAAGLPGPVRGPSSAGPPTWIRYRNARADARLERHLKYLQRLSATFVPQNGGATAAMRRRSQGCFRSRRAATRRVPASWRDINQWLRAVNEGGGGPRLAPRASRGIDSREVTRPGASDDFRTTVR